MADLCLGMFIVATSASQTLRPGVVVTTVLHRDTQSQLYSAVADSWGIHWVLTVEKLLAILLGWLGS